MSLSQPVEVSNGQILCAKGTELSEALIVRLERLEISNVTVEGNPVNDGSPRKTLEEEIVEFDRHISKVTNNKLMMVLNNVVTTHINKRHTIQDEIPTPDGDASSNKDIERIEDNHILSQKIEGESVCRSTLRNFEEKSKHSKAYPPSLASLNKSL